MTAAGLIARGVDPVHYVTTSSASLRLVYEEALDLVVDSEKRAKG